MTDTWVGIAALNHSASPGTSNTILVKAIDTNGTASDIVTLTIFAADSGGSASAPALSVTTPASDLTLTGDDGTVYSVVGVATSTVGIASVTVSGQTVQLDGSGNFTALVILGLGPNTITTTATDVQAVPLTTTITRTVTLVQGTDTGGTDITVSADQVRLGIRIHERGVE